MPEGPIIAILKQNVKPFIGKKVVSASSDNGVIDTSNLNGQTITDFKSFGKNFFICFKKFSVRIHLMMFGSYTINEHKDREPRLGLQFENGEINFYTCVVERIDQPLDGLYDWKSDVMNPGFDTGNALESLKQNPKALACDVLLDQHIFTGVGNIIRNEVLFRTRIHPQSVIGAIPEDKLKEMIDEAVNYSFDFFKWKQQNTLSKHWEAYEQKTCPRDHINLHKANLGKTKRVCYYCDKCMKKYV